MNEFWRCNWGQAGGYMDEPSMSAMSAGYMDQPSVWQTVDTIEGLLTAAAY